MTHFLRRNYTELDDREKMLTKRCQLLARLLDEEKDPDSAKLLMEMQAETVARRKSVIAEMARIEERVEKRGKVA